MKNNKGLSTIVTMLIIVLLALVAVGIIWQVVKGFTDETTDKIQQTTKCGDLDLSISKIVNNSDTEHAVTLKLDRGKIIDGIKVSLFNATESTSPIDIEENITELETKTIIVTSPSIVNANKIEVTPFFIDEAGEYSVCTSIQATKTFTL